VTPTRGARVCTWKQAERVLAGFPDGRADEGPTSAPSSLLGLRIAREHGWSAPPVPEPHAQPDAREGGR
jgi:NADH-quinone oxidoreductase subunit E